MKTIKWSNLYVPLVFPLYFYDNWHLLSRQEILQWEATQWTMLSSTFWQWRPFSPHNNRIDKRHEMNPLIRKRHAILKCEQLAFWAAWAWDQALRVRDKDAWSRVDITRLPRCETHFISAVPNCTKRNSDRLQTYRGWTGFISMAPN